MNCNDKKSTVLVALANNKYLDHAKHLFYNASREGCWPGDFALIKTEPSDRDDEFRDRGIEVIQPPVIGTDFGEFERTNFQKLYLFGPDFAKWDQLLYLDCDMVIKKPLTGITRFSKIGGVPGAMNPTLRARLYNNWPRNSTGKRLHEEFKERFGLEGIGYNGGLYLVNRSALADVDFEALLEFFRHFHSLFAADNEGAISAYFKSKFKALPYCYNTKVDEGSQVSWDEPGIVLHFMGSPNPWDPDCSFYDFYTRNVEGFNSAKEIKGVPESSFDYESYEEETETLLLKKYEKPRRHRRIRNFILGERSENLRWRIYKKLSNRQSH